MCGRFTTPEQELVMRDVFNGALKDYRRSFNVAPSQLIPAVKAENTFTLFRWGLIPSWAKDVSIGNKMINARAETLLEKPSFKKSFQTRRCLIISDGFYEWKKIGTKKQPYYIRLKEAPAFALGGIWDRWISPEGEVIESATIITTAANELISELH